MLTKLSSTDTLVDSSRILPIIVSVALVRVEWALPRVLVSQEMTLLSPHSALFDEALIGQSLGKICKQEESISKHIRD